MPYHCLVLSADQLTWFYFQLGCFQCSDTLLEVGLHRKQSPVTYLFIFFLQTILCNPRSLLFVSNEYFMITRYIMFYSANSVFLFPIIIVFYRFVSEAKKLSCDSLRDYFTSHISEVKFCHYSCIICCYWKKHPNPVFENKMILLLIARKLLGI